MTNPADTLRVVMGHLDEVVMLRREREEGAAGCFMRMFESGAADFLRTHGPAIAQALEDSRRWNELVETWGGMGEVAGHYVLVGVSTPRWKAPIGVENFNEAFDRRYELDAAIAATEAAHDPA